MIANGLTQRLLLALVCCLALIAVPLSVGAQTPGGIIKKGAQGVQKGVETGAEKTKEGAEAAGREVKKGVTGEDTNKDTSRMKGTETESTTESSTESQATKGETTTKSTTTERGNKGGEKLPATAGELPLLALAGSLALAAAGTSILVHRIKS